MDANRPSLAEPWPFIRTMVAVEEVDSTSDRAAELIRQDGLSLPLCVWARRQTRGRGRGRHTWWSDLGSLTFTLAVDPAQHGLAEESDPKLALSTVVAVVEALVDLGFDAPALGVRWPNDVEVDGRKLAGILPERIDTPQGRRILIGVGINVMSDPACMPAEVRHMATSLAAFRGRELDAEILPRLLRAILDRFGSMLARLAVKDPELARRWNALDLLRDEWVSVDLGPRIVAGRGSGIDEDGALWLDDGNARQRLIGGQVLR